MTVMILGLLVFLGTHSVRMVAGDWRDRQLARRGEGPWKGIYSVLSIAGLALIVWGYGQTRATPIDLWYPPLWTRHFALLIMVFAFIMLVAAYVPGNSIKRALGHPMLAGVVLWSLAHLFANGRAADIVLFGAFLIWSVADYTVSRTRDRRAGVVYPLGSVGRNAIVVLIGLTAWGLFVGFAHRWLIGVSPM